MHPLIIPYPLKHSAYILFAFLMLLLLPSCKEQRDRNGVLSESVMVDALYDYQLAIALANEDAKGKDKEAEVEYRYTNAVLKKYGLTAEEFNLSIAHCARDPKQLLSITEKVSKRFSEEQSIQTDDDSQIPSVGRDTTIVWQQRRGFILSANNVHRVHLPLPVKHIKSDSKILFGFKSRWIYREGNKQCTILLAVTFDNDSTAYKTSVVRDYMDAQGVSINVPPSRRVKKLDASLYQSATWQQTPQILCVNDLSLVSISNKKE